ncbi:MAG: hypothetical protein DWQ34_22670 [Planctomycetota bacterium]|nr:MAG: hypothetical protein DWQ34_22670 [Planctomycetota bacterium]REK30647.1 MAG: hypothetical protein DWQ41_01475 [Planctomycetota bacterium]REK33021.1 MAG: hypothetical protein DWQ45_15575 [Planctomycetota bacterium]
MAATECDRFLQLSPTQQAAIEHLLAGKSDRETGEAVGVHRTTVTDWRRHHPAFRAELNARRAEIRDVATERLLKLVSKAVEALEAELDGGRNRFAAAMHILKAAGLTELPKGGATEAEDELNYRIAAQAASVRRRREDKLPIAERAMAELCGPTPEQMLADRAEAEQVVRAALSERFGDADDDSQG